jgi:hypothetical protein
MQACKLSSTRTGARLVKIFCLEGLVLGWNLLVMSLVLFLLHHKIQGCQGRDGLEMSMGQGHMGQ